ncbi:MAG: ankyrin repeat domain-containing protein [Alphaproteobacteria bacterium]|nr:ankyrin repeat domain-containing protein [Alphaproteobacteria bacterium]
MDRPYGTCLHVFTSTTGVLIGLVCIAPDMADSKKPIRQAGEIASLLIAIVFVASDALPAKIGSNSHLCDDLDRAYRADGGAGTFRKLNFYLFDAAERGCLSLARRFVDIGADVEARDRFGNTALNIAARMGHQDLIGYLLEEGSDFEKANLAGSTPLLRAVESDRRRAAKALLDAGADPNVANLKGIRPLIAAAFNGNDRLVKLLLEHGADPDHADRTGKSAIIYAAGKGFGGIVEQLIGTGVPADAADAHALTPLMWAAGHANDVPADEAIATIELLLTRGASIDLQDDRGRSALMIAAERGHGEVVRHLMAAGADRLQQDKNGKRALDLAADPSVRSLLEGS